MLRLVFLLLAVLLDLTAEASAQSHYESCEGMEILQNYTKGASSGLVNLPTGTGVSYCITPHTNPDSSLIVDCGNNLLNGATPDGQRRQVAFRVVGDVKDVTIRNCRITNYEQGIEIGLRTWAADAVLKRQDEEDLYQAFTEGADAFPIEERIRARQPRRITLQDVEISNVANGVYVYPHASFVTFSWSSVRDATGVAIYVDSGSQHNWITDSEFYGSGGSREAIAIDASAFNKIYRNSFYEGWKGAIAIYRNCGEDLFPRFQSARTNRIKHNEFYDLPYGVAVASRADKLFSNRKGTESFNNCSAPARKRGECPPPAPPPGTATPYSWFCLGGSYRLPTSAEMMAEGINPDTQSTMPMSWIAPDLVSSGKLPESSYPRYSYYRDDAFNNVVRCNFFVRVPKAISVADNGAFVQNNIMSGGGGAIVVGSRVRSSTGNPVKEVNVVGNRTATGAPVSATILTGAAGTEVTWIAGIASQWGETETCE